MPLTSSLQGGSAVRGGGGAINALIVLKAIDQASKVIQKVAAETERAARASETASARTRASGRDIAETTRRYTDYSNQLQVTGLSFVKTADDALKLTTTLPALDVKGLSAQYAGLSDQLNKSGLSFVKTSDDMMKLETVLPKLDVKALTNQYAGLSEQLNKSGTSFVKGGEAAEETAGKLSKFVGSLKSIAAEAAVAAATVAAAGAAIGKAFALAEQGAAFEQTRRSFVGLTESVGSNVSLLNELRQASRGTIDDFSLMSSAAVALSGVTGEFGNRLAEALPEILEIAKAANKANPALGDVGFMFQSLTTGLKRLSPRLIDNTGLQIKLADAYNRTAERLGKTRNELTAAEQQWALLDATLEAGRVLTDQVGGSVEALTDPYHQLRADVKNVTNEFKAWLSEGLTPVVATIDLVLFRSRKINQALQDHSLQVRETAGSYDEWIDEMLRAGVASEVLDEAEAEIIKRLLEEKATIEEVLAALEDRRRQQGLGSSANEDFVRTTQLVTQAEDETTKALESAARAAEAYENRMRGIVLTSEDLEAIQEQLAKTLKEKVATAVSDVKEQFSDLQFFISAPIEKELERFEDQKQRFDQQITDLRTKFSKLTDMKITISEEDLQQLAIDFEESGGNVDLLIAAITELGGKRYYSSDQRIDMVDLFGDLENLQTEFGETAKEHDEAMKKIKFDILQRAAEGAIAQLQLVGEMAAAAGDKAKVEEVIAQQQAIVSTMGQFAFDMGLIDQDTKNMFDNATTAFQEFTDTGDVEALKTMLGDVVGIADDLATERTVPFEIEFSGDVGLLEDLMSQGLLSGGRVNIPIAVEGGGGTVYGPGAGGREETGGRGRQIGEGGTGTGGTGGTGTGGTGTGGGTSDNGGQSPKQLGGLVFRGQDYLTGETGPEIFAPPVAGRIIPANQTRDILSNLNNQSHPIIVQINNPVISSQIDVEALALQVASKIAIRQRTRR